MSAENLPTYRQLESVVKRSEKAQLALARLKRFEKDPLIRDRLIPERIKCFHLFVNELSLRGELADKSISHQSAVMAERYRRVFTDLYYKKPLSARFFREEGSALSSFPLEVQGSNRREVPSIEDQRKKLAEIIATDTNINPESITRVEAVLDHQSNTKNIRSRFGFNLLTHVDDYSLLMKLRTDWQGKTSAEMQNDKESGAQVFVGTLGALLKRELPGDRKKRAEIFTKIVHRKVNDWTLYGSFSEWKAYFDNHPEWHNLSQEEIRNLDDKTGKNFLGAFRRWLSKKFPEKELERKLAFNALIVTRIKDRRLNQLYSDWRAEYEEHPEWYGLTSGEMRKNKVQGSMAFSDAFDNWLSAEYSHDENLRRKVRRGLMPVAKRKDRSILMTPEDWKREFLHYNQNKDRLSGSLSNNKDYRSFVAAFRSWIGKNTSSEEEAALMRELVLGSAVNRSPSVHENNRGGSRGSESKKREGIRQKAVDITPQGLYGVFLKECPEFSSFFSNDGLISGVSALEAKKFILDKIGLQKQFKEFFDYKGSKSHSGLVMAFLNLVGIETSRLDFRISKGLWAGKSESEVLDVMQDLWLKSNPDFIQLFKLDDSGLVEPEYLQHAKEYILARVRQAKGERSFTSIFTSTPLSTRSVPYFHGSHIIAIKKTFLRWGINLELTNFASARVWSGKTKKEALESALEIFIGRFPDFKARYMLLEDETIMIKDAVGARDFIISNVGNSRNFHRIFRGALSERSPLKGLGNLGLLEAIFSPFGIKFKAEVNGDNTINITSELANQLLRDILGVK